VLLTQSTGSRSDAPTTRRGCWIVFTIGAAIFLATTAYVSVSGDVWTASVASWQIATTGSPWLEMVDLPALEEHPLRYVWVLQLESGHEVIGRSPGAVVAGLPAYALFGSDDFSLVPGAATAAIITAVSTVLVFATVRQWLSHRDAILAALTFGVSTPVWSVASNGIWPHTITVFGICGMAWAASKDNWWLVGLFGGVALWGRLHVAVIVAIVGLVIGWRRRDVSIPVRVGLVSALFLALQGAWTRWMYESWNPMASYDTDPFESFVSEHRIDLVNHLGFWVSPDRGLLVWTPIVLVMLPSLVRNWRRLPDWSTTLVWAGVAYTLLQGTLNRFSGGDMFYGYRLTLELLACSAPAFALSAAAMGRRARMLFPYVLSVQTFAIAAGAFNGQLGTRADRVWRENSLITAFAPLPLVGVLGLVIALLVGYLAARIWTDPTIRPKTLSGPPASD
jgi:hypothetical protein